MGLNDRLFAPPAQDAAKIEARLAMLPPRLRTLIQQAGDALAQNDLQTAQRVLACAVPMAPDQPDIRRLYGLLLARVGNIAAAISNFEYALRAAPDDAFGYWQYAQVCEQAGDIDAAARLRRQAVERLSDSPLAWADLGEHQSNHGSIDESLIALQRATRLAPDYAPACLKLGNVLVACGRAQEGAAAIREALRSEPAFGAAWLSLADIKTVPVTENEAERMRVLLESTDIDEHERTAVKFALAKMYEDHGRYHEALDLFIDANARRKRELEPWDVGKFLAQARRSEEVFTAQSAAAENPDLGREVIFVAGMPRSGTTLVEQILASHPRVRGAGELGELAQVLTEESSRLQCRYPEWVPQASARDWQRLGQRYLDLASRFRTSHGRFTDKMPNNWQAIGAIRAMLPGARIVICRRDPLENCWSCFKQFFPQGWEFTYDLDQLGVFWKTFDRAASWWSARAPGSIRAQRYEALTEDPESEIHALLAFCGLPFDPACLAFHQSRRHVHTLSAAQVRQPMHKHARTAAAYGALLDPLRRALDIPPTGGIPANA